MKYIIFTCLVNLITFNIKAQSDKMSMDPNKKIALVIGVENYQFSNPIKTAINDAIAMDSVLTSLGWEVDVLLDPAKRNIEETIFQFKQKMKEAKECFIYYSGHSIQYEGKNYIFSTSSNPVIPEQISIEGFCINQLLKTDEDSTLKYQVVMLDAARPNPLAISWLYSRKFFRQGLAGFGGSTTPLTYNTFVSIPTWPGQTVLEKEGTKYSRLTNAFLQTISNKGLELDELYRKVNGHIRKETNDTQAPVIISTVAEDIILNK